MSTIRKARPANATIMKGSLRNLLDGSNKASLPHLANKIETIHPSVLDHDEPYSLDPIVELLNKDTVLAIYNRDYFIMRNSRGNDVDLIVVGYNNNYCVARGYSVNDKEQVFAVQFSRPSNLTLEKLLYAIWGQCNTSIKEADSDGYEAAGVLAFERSTGNLLIPNEYFANGDIYQGNIENADFILLDNTESKPVSSSTVIEPNTFEAQTTENKGNNTMSKVTSLVAANKSAAATAAKLEAGKVALTQLTKVAAKALPSGMAGMFAKQYLDTPVGRVVVANLLNLAIEQYAPSNQKAKIVAKAAMDAAMLEVVQSFNISEMIEKAIEGINIDALTANVSEE